MVTAKLIYFSENSNSAPDKTQGANHILVIRASLSACRLRSKKPSVPAHRRVFYIELKLLRQSFPFAGDGIGLSIYGDNIFHYRCQKFREIIDKKNSFAVISPHSVNYVFTRNRWREKHPQSFAWIILGDKFQRGNQIAVATDKD